MRQLRGFSLAEVLITLSIVGVIASVTLPSLQLNVEKQKVGPMLMKAINTLEVANSVALQMAEAVTLDEIDTNYLGGALKDYTKLANIPYNPSTGTKITGSAYATKDGIVLIEEAGLASDAVADVKTSGSYYKIVVDINNEKGPNKFGRDLFRLYVDSKGMIIPEGSKLGIGYLKDWKTWDDAENGCLSITKDKKEAPKVASKCAGSVTDNGGRVLYFYDAIK